MRISFRVKNPIVKELEKTKVTLKEALSLPTRKARISIWDDNIVDEILFH